MENNNDWFIIPDQNKKDRPLKIVFDGLPCPLQSGLHCEYAESSMNDTTWSISCSNKARCKETCRIIRMINDSVITNR